MAEKTGFRVLIAGGGVAGLLLANALEVRLFVLALIAFTLFYALPKDKLERC